MPIEDMGNNALKLSSEGGTLEEMEARVAAAEAKGLESLEAPKAPPADETKPNDAPEATGPQEPAPQKDEETGKSSDGKKPDPLQKFKNPDGSLNPDKIEKSNEHLQRGIESRTEKLLKLNRELNKKFTTTSQQLAATSKATDAPDDLQFTDEGKKKILEDLEKDPIETILKVVRTATRKETARLNDDVSSLKEHSRESRELKELDDLVQEGHSWIVEDGLSRFDKVFSERPWLRQSPEPFRDALRFMEFPRTDGQPAKAQVGSKTPVLGASTAVPPPSSKPPLTQGQELSRISVELRKAMADGDNARMAELEAQYDRVAKGWKA